MSEKLLIIEIISTQITVSILETLIIIVFILFSAPSVVAIHSVNAVKDILNNFGDFIQNFGIDFNELSESEASEIFYLLNEKSAKTLKTLKLEHFKPSLLNNLKYLFNSVTSLAFSPQAHYDVYYQVQLVDIFPNVEQFQINNWNDHSFLYFGEFPNLNLITLGEIEESYGLDLPLKLNQVNTLRLLKPNKIVFDTIKALNRFKRLEIYGLSDNWDFTEKKIHLNNVEIVTIKINGDHKMLGHIIFDKTQELTLEITDTEETNKWIEFIDNHSKIDLNTFTLNIESLTEQQLNAIAKKFSKLKIICRTDCLNNDKIKQFLTQSRNVQNLDITLPTKNPDLHSLKNELAANWDVQFTPSNPNGEHIQIATK